MITTEIVKSLILGHAIGDALGVPVEFQSRAVLSADPVMDMRGYGTYNVPAGAWSDDTSMTLALIDSISRLGRLDYEDMMNNFSKWANHGVFTPTDFAFDIGGATRNAIIRYDGGKPALECGGTSGATNGNGSLMRISPMALYVYEKYDGQVQADEPLQLVHTVSSLTHAHPRSLMACGIYVLVAAEILRGKAMAIALHDGLQAARRYYSQQAEFSKEMDNYASLWEPDFEHFDEGTISSGGYVVDTLEAVMWCLLNTKSYKGCVLRAVNMGADTDTVGAIAGGLAGLYYGMDSIPEEWRDQLIRHDYIEGLCEKFAVFLQTQA